MPENGRIREFLGRLFRSRSQAGSGPSDDAPAVADTAAEASTASPSPEETPPDAPEAPPVAPQAPPPPEAIVPPAPAPQVPAETPALLSAEAAEKLARLPQALADLAAAIQSQTALNQRLQEVLAGFAEPDQDLLHAMQDLAAEGQKQTDLLHNLGQRLAERRQLDNLAAGAMVRLPALLESLHKSNAALIEMMQQTRDRWASTKDDLAKEIVRQGRKATALVVGILTLLAVQTVLLLVRLLGGR
jgi:pyruvate/2-oxoglutarate dehydrogenase complex dihydrolipoamide acyltransferase (E2) component